MSRGYLLFALNTERVDYTKLAHACALSIKLTQPNGYDKVSVVTNTPEKINNELGVFDHIIEYTGPLGMDARSRAYDFTPYNETVLLDSDMLFLRSVDHYWTAFEDRDLYITTHAQDHRGRKISYGPYRTVFETNQWPDVYSAWTYFRKSDTAQEFFNLVKDLTDNQQAYLSDMIALLSLKSIPTDEAFALALVLLGIEDQATSNSIDYPRITHMKPAILGWADKNVLKWTDKMRFYLDKSGKVTLGTWAQADILHYVEKDLITDSVIKTLEAAL